MFQRVQTKFSVAIILVVSLFLLSLLLINYGLLRSYSLTAAGDTAELMWNRADKQINQVFQEIEYLTRSMADYRPVKDANPEEMRALFISTVLVRQSYIRAIYLGTEMGEMYEWGVGEGFTDHTPEFPPDYDPRRRPWYRTAMARDGYALTDPYIYASVAALGVTAVIPVRTDDGELVGVLGVDIILEGLQNVVESLKIQKDGKIMLLTPRGKILASQFLPPRAGTAEIQTFEYPQLLEGQVRTELENIYDQRYLITRGRNSATGWWILLAVPYDSIMAFSLENLKIIVSIDLLLTLLLGTVITTFTRRILTSPLEGIMNTMRRMERGELDARISHSGEDEFASIGRLFNRLADIRAESSRRMEEKVKARTEAVLRLQQENLRLRIIEEKETIYGNLHDSLGARLTGINISNNVAITALSKGDARVTREMLTRIERNTKMAIQDLREILFPEEEPGEERSGGSSGRCVGEFLDYLEGTLRTRLSLKDIGLESTLPGPEELEVLPPSLLGDLQKLIQEIFSNLIKHSRADRAWLTLELSPKKVHLVVKDDGVGFNLREESRSGFGIQSLFNRAERMGGILKIHTKPGKGTLTELQLKLEGTE